MLEAPSAPSAREEPPASGDLAPDGRPRRWFQVALGTILCPVLSLPFVWGLALYWLRRARDGEGRRWARRLLALAAVDLLVTAAVVVLSLHEPEPAPPPPPDRVVIGVFPDAAFSGPGVRIRAVTPGSPADVAGIRPGDVLTRLGGTEVGDVPSLARALDAGGPDVATAVEVARGASRSTVPITPTRSSRLPRARRGVFEPVGDARACVRPPGLRGVLALLANLAALCLVGAMLARRGSAAGVWWTALAVLAAGAGSYAMTSAVCLLLGGLAPAVFILSLYGSGLVLAGVAFAGWRRLGDPGRPVAPRPFGRTVATGAWWLLTGGIRATVLAAALDLVLHGDRLAGPTSPLDGPTTASGGLSLLAAGALLVAPVGEELAYRGLLQPALSRHVSPSLAVAVTSLLFAAMHWYYGPYVLLVVLVGAVLGWARVATGRLAAPMALHALVNAAALLLALLRTVQGGR